MTNPVAIPEVLPAPEETQNRWSPNLRWIGLGIIINAALWGLAFLFLKLVTPTYISEWSIILPGAQDKVNVSVPEVGQTTSDVKNPTKKDPINNYQYIATSPPILTAAATAVNMSLEEFGEPEIIVIKNTTIMEFHVTGHSATEAQQKSQALYQALLRHINSLRYEETARRNEEIKSPLRYAKAKLEAAQQELTKYNKGSVLSSPEQITNLSSNIEQLRRQRVDLVTQQQKTNARIQQLSAQLGLSAQDASDTLTLQGDKLFQQYLENYAKASSNRLDLLSRWLPNSPAVLIETTKQQDARSALISRSRVILGKPVTTKTLELLTLKSSGQSEREKFLSELIEARAEQQGVKAQLKSLEPQFKKLESRLKDLTKDEIQFNKLRQELQVAQTVFGATAAKLDLSQVNSSASYPPVQVLSKPSLPEEPDFPSLKMVLLTALAMSFLATTGLWLFWAEKHGGLLKRFLREDSYPSSSETPQSE